MSHKEHNRFLEQLNEWEQEMTREEYSEEYPIVSRDIAIRLCADCEVSEQELFEQFGVKNIYKTDALLTWLGW